MKKIGRENQYQCDKCQGIFGDAQRNNEDDDRCPICKVAYSQMPYEQPHEISNYKII